MAKKNLLVGIAFAVTLTAAGCGQKQTAAPSPSPSAAEESTARPSSQTEGTGSIVVKQDGTGDYPTIQEAVEMAQPGDTVLVYNGVYRETVIFPKGGTDDSSRITLKANPGDTVLITGSEPVEPEEWSKDKEKVYKMTKDNTYFGDFNPFAEKWGAKSEDYPDFFSCGSVYLNDTVLEQVFEQQDVYTKDLSWYAVTDDKITTIWANFGGEDPTGEKNSTEINKRKQCIRAVWNPMSFS